MTKRVLIVDDEEDLAAALMLRLTAGWGFAACAARDGEDGLRKAASFKPDVILLDVAMPGSDGWELCRRLRDDPLTRRIPVVVMTAWDAKGLDRRAAAEGAVAVLRKPLEEGRLLSLLTAQTGRTS